MPGYFVDSSALVKLYHAEAGSQFVADLFAQSANAYFVSRLSVLEIQSAFVRRVLEREIDKQQFDIYRQGFLNDVASETIRVYRTPPHYLRTAERLLLRHGTSSRLRTLDALQLAIASEARSRGHVEQFLSADASLCSVAELEGFETTNPLGAS
jgi:predicted nucleic acid-binding protein